MNQRRRVFILILIMVFVCLMAESSTIFFLYKAAFSQQKARLVETAQSQARLIEAIARFDARNYRNYKDGWVSATLVQVMDAHNHYKGFGKTGEFTLARREGDNIRFILRHRHLELGKTRIIPIKSGLAEPMKWALDGFSGTLTGFDYRGEMVLAAHEPVKELNLGIVAKIDLSEVREPFIKSAFASGMITIIAIIIAVILFIRVSNPLLSTLEKKADKLEKLNLLMADEILKRKESESRFRTLVETIPYGIQEINRDGEITFINSEYAKITGYDVEDLSGKTCYELLPTFAEAERLRRDIELFVNEQPSPETYYNKNMKSDGTQIDIRVDWNYLFNHKGAVSGFVSVITDITEQKRMHERLGKLYLELEQRVKKRTAELEAEVAERKKTETLLKQNQTILQIVYDGISDPIIMVDQDMAIRILNRAAEIYYDVDLCEAEGKECFCSFREKSELCEGCQIYSAVKNKETITFERKGVSDSGKYEEVSVYPIADGSVGSGAIIHIRDITENKRIQTQLIRADRIASLGQLSGGIAHEIRNPLAGIRLFVDILTDEKRFERTDLEFEIYDEITKNINKMDGIVKRVLNFSKPPACDSGEIEINSLIEETLELFRAKMAEANIIYRCMFSDENPSVYGDSIGLQQVLVNLILNAIDAMCDGGTLTLFSSHKRQTDRQNRIMVDVKIKDTGPGLDKDQIENVFNPFYTTKPAGTGLGLAISHQIIEHHGGNIYVNSDPGEGSVFGIELPATV